MGVKSLWSLLEPVGRPVPLESVEGKALAIDSSIWLYQFQATMRDKEGHGLVNAHVLGFLRRICKLLFYGVKPVFVFDGGAPALKRNTILERKKKKSGAAVSHAKIAERLLAAQMRREALVHARPPTSKGNSKVPAAPASLDETAVYLEDLEADSSLRTLAKPPSLKHGALSPYSSTKKNRFHDYDPYSLPDIDLSERIAHNTHAGVAPDPRLATEEELRAFIEEMRPEDIDVTSPEFRELPTEVQYEIVGDLRLKSRQTSHARLQTMLRGASTPLDFSRAQIMGLKQRNALTQQLLETTDSIGKAHITIPVRIASERNREYVLVKNEGAEGGWVLGIRDEGSTRTKPIKIDHDDEFPEDEDLDEDMDLEEVPIPGLTEMDPDLRAYQQTMALSAIGKRAASHPAKPVQRKNRERFLFDLGDEELPMYHSQIQAEAVEDEDHADHAIAIHASLNTSGLLSTQVPSSSNPGPSMFGTASSLLAETTGFSTNSTSSATCGTYQAPSSKHVVHESSDEECLYATPSRLQTSLSIGGAVPHLRTSNEKQSLGRPGDQSTLSSGIIASHLPPTPMPPRERGPSAPFPTAVNSESDEGTEEIIPQLSSDRPELGSVSGQVTGRILENEPPQTSTSEDRTSTPIISAPAEPFTLSSDSEGDMEEIVPSACVAPASSPILNKLQPMIVEADDPASHGIRHANDDLVAGISEGADHCTSDQHGNLGSGSTERIAADASMIPSTRQSSSLGNRGINVQSNSHLRVNVQGAAASPNTAGGEAEVSDAESLTDWSQPPATTRKGHGEQQWHMQRVADDVVAGAESWDAVHEMDPHAEEGEFARFVSAMRGRDIDTVRREIDDEIRTLNQQKKAAMRDSEDVTTQMISQIMLMLRLFGIPYITAPMEAEAQCAELVQLGLVEGVITDDSDVFLFGGPRVFKNMFNQSKTVECFLLSDLARELGLERDTLIRLAYLLGSDYVEGLPGIGPVVAMELLKEFPGLDGLHKFKDWWSKVQTGRDKAMDNQSKFRKRFKKKFKDLYLPPEWPNPQVRDAYYHPTVDSSREPFKWGIPDLDALREFLHEELGWGQSKVDDLLLPIIQKMNRRKQATSSNRQGNLNTFLDVPSGTGSYAPRKRQAYGSKRLQQVVSDFRRERAHKQGQRPAAGPGPGGSRSGSVAAFGSDDGGEGEGDGGQDTVEAPQKKRRKTASAAASSSNAGLKESEDSRKPKVRPKPRQRKNTATDAEHDGVATETSLPQRKLRGKDKGKGKITAANLDRVTANADTDVATRKGWLRPHGSQAGSRSCPWESGSDDDFAEATGGDNDDDFNSGVGASAIPSRPLEVQLRPRASPKLKLVSSERKKRAVLYDASTSDGSADITSAE